MSNPMTDNEKIKMKLIRQKFNQDKDSVLTIAFVNSVKNNEITYGAKILDFDKVLNFCKEKELDGINSFKAILCYAVKGEPMVSQSILGSWFNESSDLGNSIKYMVTDYYDTLMRERRK